MLISHPLGAAFVDDLREKDPSVVPHSLPSRQALLRLLLSTNSPLRLDAHTDSSPASDSAAAVPYLAVLRKSAVLPLADGFAALAGPVCAGYGRGSRKLGVPTANLPCSLFQSQLAELRTRPEREATGSCAACHNLQKQGVNAGLSRSEGPTQPATETVPRECTAIRVALRLQGSKLYKSWSGRAAPSEI